MGTILNISLDVAKNIKDTKSLELIITTGNAIREMFINDANLKDNDLYLVKMNDDGSINSYSCLAK